ncbi:MAG: hypothetical protein HN846_05025 [Candidatus Pacebacteria bacterium]|jgi:reversibly glycosylated polypeptide / UDP-arabinopyranose mutase|nr:hypothetical protein [Candidatus Paceibacterota bacterium]MBT4004780.1 hypothetical protein [Candidatus Paceibacterota bacterium]MBT7184129.1 hypothetical protein [Candidatus Paceibacterota bacterium]MBT7310039.1 hypothetical protein [Candidatus Paceibacterota bacterium]
MKKTFVVIPTIRDLGFLNDWKEQFKDVSVIVCEDRPQKTLRLPKIGQKIYHYSWEEIDQDLGDNSWIIPRKVSGIRSFGFIKAYDLRADIIITIDDDCYPVKNHNLIKLHSQNLSLKTPLRWTNTYPDIRHLYTRGIPYLNREEMKVMISHGLWTNVLDFDGPTHLQNMNFKAEFAEHFLQIIPHGSYYPMCSMNLAFNREVTPLMYFPLMGENNNGNKWGYDRFDDIWAGIFSKKIMDHLGYSVVNGAPFVEHRKASNPFKNLIKEAGGIEINEQLWQAVDKVELTTNTTLESYHELIEKVDFPKNEYFKNLKKAIPIWISLFE